MQKKKVMLTDALNVFYKLFAVMTTVLAITALSISVSGAELAQQPRKIMLASTIGPIDAGIVGVLEAAFTKKTGITVEHVGAGTGQALKNAESGNFDLVLVHAKALEEKFVADGFGTKRYDLMYNDFVILGPPDDPAIIKGEKNVAVALRKVVQAGAPFVTRGDKSGTHVKELEVWKKAGIEPTGPWYIVFEQGSKGNAPTLAFVNEKQAYTIMDRATYITMKQKVTLQILVERDEVLLNFMTVIPVNPVKFPQINHYDALQFVEWLQGKEAQTIIKDFGKEKYGEPLFFPNSPEGKKL
jgi:tungstate transport system substrate-binding protein